MKLFKRLIIILLVVAVCGGFVYGVVDANTRFPQQTKEYYSAGEWVPYDDSIEIKGKKVNWYTADEFNEKYNKKFSEDWHIIEVSLLVKNKSDKAVDFFMCLMNCNLVLLPIGYENQGQLIQEDSMIQPHTFADMTAYFFVTDGLIRSSRIDEAMRGKFYFTLKTYPVCQAIVFDGAKEVIGSEEN